MQTQLDRLRSHDVPPDGSISTTSPSSQSAQTFEGFTPRVQGNELDDIQFLIPEEHCTSTTWLLSLPALRRLLGEFPQRYFHSLEKSVSIPSEFCHQHDSLSMFSINEGERDSLAQQYFAASHHHYPILLGELSDAVRVDANLDRSSPLAKTVEQLVCAIGKSHLSSRLAAEDSAVISTHHTNITTGSINDVGSTEDAEGGAQNSASLFRQAVCTVNDHLCWSFTPSILLCQALVLAASYLAHVGRPLHSWRYAQFAFSAYQQIQTDSSFDHSVRDGDALRRVYWSCFLLECDRAAELDLPRSGIEAMADKVPLPIIQTEDDYSTTAFLAEISIRRLLNRIHNSLYSRRDRARRVGMPQLEKVAGELDRQLTGWYDSIPKPVRPPLGIESCQNDRARVLRIRYYAAKHIIHRPSLLCVAANPAADFTSTSTMASAQSCVEACRMYLLNSTEMLGKRTPYLWTFSASSLGALFVFSIARSVPSLRWLVGDLEVLQRLYQEKLKPWATAGSSLEAMVWMVETMMAKEKHL